LGTAIQLLQVTKTIESMLEEFDTPMLILHGDNDTTTDHAHSELLFERSQNGDKTLILYEGQYHGLTYDVMKHEVLEDVFNWLSQRIETPNSLTLPLKVKVTRKCPYSL